MGQNYPLLVTAVVVILVLAHLPAAKPNEAGIHKHQCLALQNLTHPESRLYSGHWVRLFTDICMNRPMPLGAPTGITFHWIGARPSKRAAAP